MPKKDMRKNILIMLTLFCISLQVLSVEYPKNPDAKVNEIIIKKTNFSGINGNEQIIYTVSGESFNHPFLWSVDIFKDNKKIFHYEQNDKNKDEFFSDLGYVDNDCKNYIECKHSYYFDHIPNSFIFKFNEPSFNSVSESITKYLTEAKGLKNNEIATQLNKLKAKAKTASLPVLYINTSSVTNGNFYIYLAEQMEFLEVAYGCC